MNKRLVCLMIAYGALAIKPSRAQTSADVLTILQTSLVAQAGRNVIQDVTLSGSAESIAGSDDETASFSFEGTLTGSARTDLALSAGMITEIRLAASAGAAAGTWSKGNGKKHNLSGHNLMTDPAWCSPVLLVERLTSNSMLTVAYVDTQDGLAHFRAVPVSAEVPAKASALIQRLGQIDLYLDPQTFLPARLTFNTHPDDNALSDIPVRIDFSGYRTVGGVTMPMHVQRYLNGTLSLDVQFDNALVNSGLSSSSL
jgi:hypothetical protein